jgi:hypothetical protein
MRLGKKRNLSEYDRAGTVSEKEVEEIIAFARYIRVAVEEWIRAKQPNLLKDFP